MLCNTPPSQRSLPGPPDTDPLSGPGLAPAQRSFISHDLTETTTRNWTEFSYLPVLVCPVLAHIATPLYPLLSPHKPLMSSPTSCENLTSSIHKFMIYIFKCLSSSLAIRRFIHLLEFATIPFTFWLSLSWGHLTLTCMKCQTYTKVSQGYLLQQLGCQSFWIELKTKTFTIMTFWPPVNFNIWLPCSSLYSLDLWGLKLSKASGFGRLCLPNVKFWNLNIHPLPKHG